MGILVYIETENGLAAEHSVDLISFVKEISNGEKIEGGMILPDFPHEPFEKFSYLKKFGLDKLYIIKSPLEEFDKRNHGRLFVELAKKISPEIIILNSTTGGREIAPVVASSLNTGLTADCTGLEIQEGKLISTRPTYGGKLMASIICKKNPQMATVRVNTFKKKEFENAGAPLEIELVEFEIQKPLTEILNFIKDESKFSNLQNAKIILTGGMGLKNKENFDKLKYLSKLMNAKTGATRKAADKGFIEKEVQIGQTGICVTPEIYVAFGVSGAIHHTVGMENSKKIIAINTDKNAPIFQIADIGIVEDAEKVLNDLIKIYEPD